MKSAIYAEFEAYLETEQLCNSTINTYQGQVKRYFQWLHVRESADDFSLRRDDVLRFKDYLLQEKKVKPITANAYLSALIRFNEYLNETARQGEMVIRGKDYMKIQSELSNPWDGEDEDVECLFHSIIKSGEKFKERNYAITLVMAYAGLRVSEAVNLDVGDVSL